MGNMNDFGQLFPGESAYAPDPSVQSDTKKITPAEREVIHTLGKELAECAGGIWLLISGRFSSGNGERGTENQVKELLRAAFGYPKPNSAGITLNVLLNSPGGSLDSAYTTTLYLSAYSSDLNVYVPDRAKSASTLLAVGADHVYLSAFGELGPLDTQIPDPRNPANTVSALDCYQSVDYVRDFGFRTVTSVLPKLVQSTERRIPVDDLLDTATAFALGAIDPMLGSVTALDFGGWGRSLMIGEHYARKLLQAKAKDGDRAKADRIAYHLVYGYTHHLFPIDIHEANRFGLNAELMNEEVYDKAINVVDACHKKDFVAFLSKEQSELAAEAAVQQPSMSGVDVHGPDQHPVADASIPAELPSQVNDTHSMQRKP